MKGRGHLGGVTMTTMLGVSSLVPALGQSPQVESEASPGINPDGWTSARVCGDCHQSIYSVWKDSLHAQAWSSPVFQASYQRSISAYGKNQARRCLSCHAPTVRHGKDFDIQNTITAEGVTCDFCHSVSAVEPGGGVDPVRLVVGETKYGPLRHEKSNAHETIDTMIHTRSEFCASCHQYQNENGVTVLGTYREWKKSSYAKNDKQCQDCHMPIAPKGGETSDVSGKTNQSVNPHDISGSHDINRVREAIKLELGGYEWFGDRVWVFVKVINKGSGHCFPTGLPSHRAILEVTIHDGSKLVGRREIPFQIVMLDKDRRPLQREYEVLAEADSVRSDSRLKPNEERMIEISFRDIEAKRLVLNARLHYIYSTEVLVETEGKHRFEPVEMKFLVASRRNNMKQVGD